MDLTWLGHAAFRLRSGPTALIMDPFSEALGLKIPPPQAQAHVVTMSSDAPHHSAVGAVASDPQPIVFSGPGEYEVAGLHIRGIRTTRQAEEGEDVTPTWNTVFVVQAEGIVLCHLGDLGRLLKDSEIEELGAPHILLLPVGSTTGLSPADAVEVVSAISPRVIVPMLFAHPGNKSDLRGLTPFLDELGEKAPSPRARLSITHATLPEETQVALLQPAASML